MKESDQLATSFITPFESFSYVTMSFSLKNTGATYQRCMLKYFGDLIGKTVAFSGSQCSSPNGLTRS